VTPPRHIRGVTEQQLISLDVGQVHETNLRAGRSVAVRQSSGSDARRCDNLEEETPSRNPNML